MTLHGGIDWGSEEHVVCVVDDAGKVVGERKFEHTVKGLTALASWLIDVASQRSEPIRVAIETPNGPVVETLLERKIALFAINPKQLDRFRDRFSPSSAKDDRRDARVLADSLRTDERAFRKLEESDDLVVELRDQSRLHDDLTQERVRLANGLRDQLLRYYPQLLAVSSDVDTGWVLELLKLAPTPDKGRRLPLAKIARVLRDGKARKRTPEEVYAMMREPGFVVRDGTIRGASARVVSLSTRLAVVLEERRECERALKGIIARLTGAEHADDANDDAEGASAGQKSEQRDAAILSSLPGVGLINLAALLAEARVPLRDRDYCALRTLCGVAPVTKRSGKQLLVLRRQACNERLRNMAHHWGNTAIQNDVVLKAKYAALRARGHSHARAIRGLVDRLLAIACAMLRTRTMYDPSRLRLAALPAELAR
jgi:transposase